MASAIIRAGLTNSKFPFNFDELCTTVVVNKGLQTQRLGQGAFVGSESEQSQGIPQAYYMENVIPISRGFASVAYTQMAPAIPGDDVIFDVFELRGEGEGLALLAVGFEVQYIFDPDIQPAAWVEVSTGAFAPGTVTVANVKGRSYIGVGRVGVYTYDFTNKVLSLETILGLDVGEIKGWFGAGANLCAFTEDRIFWSSVQNPLDFVPSLSTGAGSKSSLAISSEITTCLSMGEDFIAYTSTNAVSGRQTGNIQDPFLLAEVPGSCGVSMSDHVAHDTNTGVHVVWTPMGFQQVTVQEAAFIWPELRDGISRGISIALDELREIPSITYLESLDVRVQYCGNGYIAISLRESDSGTLETVYTEAYIFDTQLRRWGRLKCEHAKFFEYTVQVIEGRYTYNELEQDYANYDALDSDPSPPLAYYQIESDPLPSAGIPGSNFGVLGLDGRVHVMAPQQTANFRGDNVGITSSLPRVLLGKYKVVEEEGIVLEAVKLNRLFSGEIIAHGHAYNGDILRSVDHFVQDPAQTGRWLSTVSADSITIEINGSFVLTDLSLSCFGSGTNNQFMALPRKKFYSYISTVPYPVVVTCSANIIALDGIDPNIDSDGMFLHFPNDTAEGLLWTNYKCVFADNSVSDGIGGFDVACVIDWTTCNDILSPEFINAALDVRHGGAIYTVRFTFTFTNVPVDEWKCKAFVCGTSNGSDTNFGSVTLPDGDIDALQNYGSGPTHSNRNRLRYFVVLNTYGVLTGGFVDI